MFLVYCSTQFAVHKCRLLYFGNSLFDGCMPVNDVREKLLMSPLYVVSVIKDIKCYRTQISTILLGILQPELVQSVVQVPISTQLLFLFFLMYCFRSQSYQFHLLWKIPNGLTSILRHIVVMVVSCFQNKIYITLRYFVWNV